MKRYALFLLALALTGCARETRPEQTLRFSLPPATVTDAAQTAEPFAGAVPEDPVFPASSEEVYESCATNGHVLNFSAEGCTVSVALLEDLEDGISLMVGASPGGEEAFPTAAVRYGPECTFIQVNASLSTKELDCAEVPQSEVKMGTYIVVHGQIDSDGSILASQVYLYRVLP